jgi:hypothetical protein
MRFGCSLSDDYTPNRVVIRDFKSTPKGRVLCIIARDNLHEANQIAQTICDLLNDQEQDDELDSV